MSKSKRNTVDPQPIINHYGADTARLFMLSDSPPERDLEWTEAGVDGAWRYVNRLWRLISEAGDIWADSHDLSNVSSDKALEIRKLTHRTIADVTAEIEAMHYNKAIAKVRELTNAIGNLSLDDLELKAVYIEAMNATVHLIAPMMPHLAEEMWQATGRDGLICEQPWPKADASLLVDNTVTIAVQVNGKLRDTLELVKDIAKEDAERAALDSDKVKQAIGEKSVKKVIVVPNKIVNVVAA